jgi:thiopurine S-methyltransferase
MDPSFWLQAWREDRTAFHQPGVNPHLAGHLDALALAPGSRVFLPLCGKTLDIGWLLARGFRVAGAELSPLAIEQLFAQLEVEPQVTELGTVARWAAPGLDVFVGDVFDVTRDMLGPVDATFDRAALVALPADMRARYAAHLVEITGGAPQLLVTFEYDPAVMEGPPFSISADDVQTYYGDRYDARLLAAAPVPSGPLADRDVREVVWLLR